MTKVSVICQIVLINIVILVVHSAHYECPVGKYLCKSKAKKCIDLTAICDGKRDCPDGEDEMSSYCKEDVVIDHYKNYNPGKAYLNEEDSYVKTQKKQNNTHVQTHNQTDQGDRYWPNNGCSAGHYLCNGTLNICVKLNDICNRVQDCPQNDDEDRDVCKNRHPKPRQQSGPISLNEEPASEPDQEPGSEQNFDGTGFMLRVDNMIIYNSDVRMFNQNSDNNEK